MESNVSFSLVIDAVDTYYNFQSEKEIMSYPFRVSFAGETFNFLETCANCRVLSIWTVIFPL